MKMSSKANKAKATVKPYDKSTKGGMPVMSGKMPSKKMSKMMTGKKMGRGK